MKTIKLDKHLQRNLLCIFYFLISCTMIVMGIFIEDLDILVFVGTFIIGFVLGRLEK